MSLDSVEAAPVQVRLFGGPVVEVGAKPVRLSKYQAYLIALVFGHGQDGLSRSKAIELLWNEPDGRRQRHRLSQLLHTLKRKLGGREIVRDDDFFLMSALPSHATDLEKINSSLEQRDHGTLSGLLGGAFLYRLEKAPTSQFDQWSALTNRRIDDAVEASLLHACLEAEEESDWQALGDAVRVAEIVCAPQENVLLYSIKHLAMRGRFSEPVNDNGTLYGIN